MIHHSIVKKTGLQRIVRGAEDWDYCKRALEHTDCLYIAEPFVYYTWTVNCCATIDDIIRSKFQNYFLPPPGVAKPFNMSVIPLIPPLPVSCPIKLSADFKRGPISFMLFMSSFC